MEKLDRIESEQKLKNVIFGEKYLYIFAVEHDNVKSYFESFMSLCFIVVKLILFC